MLSSSLRRNILADPLVDLAMHASRRHPVSMIRLKPLPDDVAVLDQSHVFRGARLIWGGRGGCPILTRSIHPLSDTRRYRPSQVRHISLMFQRFEA